MRNWMLGRTRYAHPWMRWTAVPLWRIGLLLIVVPPIFDGWDPAPIWVGLGLVVVALAVDVLNAVTLRLAPRRA